MSTRVPIAVSDIRAGDLIRCEWENDGAREFRALESGRCRVLGCDAHYLLDRPKPPVVLPTEPTLGWLTASGCQIGDAPTAALALWNRDLDPDFSIQRNGSHCGISHNWVTAFTPATAVPTDVLDELRKPPPYPVPTRFYRRRLRDFLAAVDNAGGNS